MANELTFLQSMGKGNIDTALNSINGVFSKYIVQPSNAFGVSGFVFDVEGDTTHTLTADITDHWTENNSSIQDHISLKPLEITLRSYVGEVSYREDNSSAQIPQRLTQKLTTLNSYLPKLSSGVEQAKKLITRPELKSVSINQFTDLWSLTKNSNPAATKQQQAYQYFKALFEQKILVSIQTPFEFLNNMAIKTIIAVQSEDSKYISDFSITLKKIRMAPTQTINSPNNIKPLAISNSATNDESIYAKDDYQGQTAVQRQPEVNQGITQGLPVSTINDPVLDDIESTEDLQEFLTGASGGSLAEAGI